MDGELTAARNEMLRRLYRDSLNLMVVPDENYGLYRIAPKAPDTRSRWRRVVDEVGSRIAAAWRCLRWGVSE